MVRLARQHQFRFCPRCKSEVAPDNRFCRRCSFWLARPEIEGLRAVQAGDEPPLSLVSRIRVWGQVFQSSFHLVLIGIMLGILLVASVVILARHLHPSWQHAQVEAHRNACHANIRVIQAALEAYLNDHRFTPELASDPVGVLHAAGLLHNVPRCAIDSNRYRIPRGSVLQCIGSLASETGHGAP